MKRWVWSVTEENWKIVLEKKIWAVKDELRTKKMNKDDYIIFYVKRTGAFKGIFKVISDWKKSKKPKWSDEENGKIKYPFECKLEQIQDGDAVFNELMTKLSFVRGRADPHFVLQAHSTGPANYGHPIDQSDFNIIMEEMKTLPQESIEEIVETSEHENIISKLQEIGITLGFEPYTDQEHTHVAKGCVVDLVWETKIASIGIIKYVFEVQSKGSQKSLITNLIQAINSPLVKKVIAVSDEKQLKKIKEQLSQMRALTEASKSMFVYLDINKVNKVYNTLPILHDFKSQLQLL